jgi:phosphoribosylaminoimidazole-succinocarboxamide synthase
MTLLHTSSLKSLPLLARGKVRDNYAVGTDQILMLASDRISAFDVVMGEGIPGKGQLLTQMALFWFNQLQHIVPNHLTGLNPESVVADDEKALVKGRAMLVKRLTPIPIEAVVRGYLAGSGWQEYQSTQSVCGEALPGGLRNSSPLPSPIFTPARKADMGEHDENISFAQACTLVGEALATKIKTTSLQLYEQAAAYALSRGLIIADTKFEFGLDAAGELVLMDEVLTPDSSRYWLADEHAASLSSGQNPPSFDKQFLRDWLLTQTQWNQTAPAPQLPAEIKQGTAQKYAEAAGRLGIVVN